MARLTDDEQPLPEIHLSIYRETASIVHSTLFRTSRTIPHHPAGAWSHPLQSAAPNVAEVSRPPQCDATAPHATEPKHQYRSTSSTNTHNPQSHPQSHHHSHAPAWHQILPIPQREQYSGSVEHQLGENSAVVPSSSSFHTRHRRVLVLKNHK